MRLGRSLALPAMRQARWVATKDQTPVAQITRRTRAAGFALVGRCGAAATAL